MKLDTNLHTILVIGWGFCVAISGYYLYQVNVILIPLRVELESDYTISKMHMLKQPAQSNPDYKIMESYVGSNNESFLPEKYTIFDKVEAQEADQEQGSLQSNS